MAQDGYKPGPTINSKWCHWHTSRCQLVISAMNVFVGNQLQLQTIHCIGGMLICYSLKTVSTTRKPDQQHGRKVII